MKKFFLLLTSVLTIGYPQARIDFDVLTKDLQDKGWKVEHAFASDKNPLIKNLDKYWVWDEIEENQSDEEQQASEGQQGIDEESVNHHGENGRIVLEDVDDQSDTESQSSKKSNHIDRSNEFRRPTDVEILDYFRTLHVEDLGTVETYIASDFIAHLYAGKVKGYSLEKSTKRAPEGQQLTMMDFFVGIGYRCSIGYEKTIKARKAYLIDLYKPKNADDQMADLEMVNRHLKNVYDAIIMGMKRTCLSASVMNEKVQNIAKEAKRKFFEKFKDHFSDINSIIVTDRVFVPNLKKINFFTDKVLAKVPFNLIEGLFKFFFDHNEDGSVCFKQDFLPYEEKIKGIKAESVRKFIDHLLQRINDDSPWASVKISQHLSRQFENVEELFTDTYDEFFKRWLVEGILTNKVGYSLLEKVKDAIEEEGYSIDFVTQSLLLQVINGEVFYTIKEDCALGEGELVSFLKILAKYGYDLTSVFNHSWKAIYYLLEQRRETFFEDLEKFLNVIQSLSIDDRLHVSSLLDISIHFQQMDHVNINDEENNWESYTKFLISSKNFDWYSAGPHEFMKMKHMTFLFKQKMMNWFDDKAADVAEASAKFLKKQADNSFFWGKEPTKDFTLTKKDAEEVIKLFDQIDESSFKYTLKSLFKGKEVSLDTVNHFLTGFNERIEEHNCPFMLQIITKTAIEDSEFKVLDQLARLQEDRFMSILMEDHDKFHLKHMSAYHLERLFEKIADIVPEKRESVLRVLDHCWTYVGGNFYGGFPLDMGKLIKLVKTLDGHPVLPYLQRHYLGKKMKELIQTLTILKTFTKEEIDSLFRTALVKDSHKSLLEMKDLRDFIQEHFPEFEDRLEVLPEEEPQGEEDEEGEE